MERTDRMRAAHLPADRKFFLSDKKLFHKAYIKEEVLQKYTEDTLIAVVNGGETIWITADFVESHQATYIKQLAQCPMSSKAEMIIAHVVNCGDGEGHVDTSIYHQ